MEKVMAIAEFKRLKKEAAQREKLVYGELTRDYGKFSMPPEVLKMHMLYQHYICEDMEALLDNIDDMDIREVLWVHRLDELKNQNGIKEVAKVKCKVTKLYLGTNGTLYIWALYRK